MANITYRQLADRISILTEEQQNTTVTVYDPAIDEFIPVHNLVINDDENFCTDVLDEDHPVIMIDS